MKEHRNKILALARIVGYLTGDGHIDKTNGMVVYFGSYIDGNLFQKDIYRLPHLYYLILSRLQLYNRVRPIY
jgi:hypothetical protein